MGAWPGRRCGCPTPAGSRSSRAPPTTRAGAPPTCCGTAAEPLTLARRSTGRGSIVIPALAEPARLPPGRRHRRAQPHRRARGRAGRAGRSPTAVPTRPSSSSWRCSRSLPLRARARAARSARRVHGGRVCTWRRRRTSACSWRTSVYVQSRGAHREGRRGAAAPTIAPDWQGVERHAPRRIADGRRTASTARSGRSGARSRITWSSRADGDVLADGPRRAPAPRRRARLPAAVAGRPGRGRRRRAARRRWRRSLRAVAAGALARVGAGDAAISPARRATAPALAAAAATRSPRGVAGGAGIAPSASRSGFAVLAEMAHALGDALRARARPRLAAAPPAAQAGRARRPARAGRARRPGAREIARGGGGAAGRLPVSCWRER